MKEDDIALLKRIAEFEADHDMSIEFPHGWAWRHVSIQGTILSNLYLKGYLDILLSSRACTWYRLNDKGRQAIAAAEVTDLQAAQDASHPRELVIPEDLFADIEGFEDVKRVTLRALTSSKPVHLLYTGVPGSAKTMFLLELTRLGAVYINGSDTTRAGVADLLFDQEPKILLVDEIDHISSRDNSILLSLMSTGIVAETKSGKTRRIQLKTWVFGASNTARMSPALLSRFMKVYFRPYTQEDFKQVTVSVLRKSEGLGPDLAAYIAEQVWKLPARFADPRQAINIARLAGNEKEVDEIIEMIRRRGDEFQM